MKWMMVAGAAALLSASAMAQTETQPLVGTQWQLVAYGAADNPTPALETTASTLSFNADGSAGGLGGCNAYGGSYTLNGDQLKVEGIISTMRACEPAVMEQEFMLFEALQSASSYLLEAKRLVIPYGTDARLIFEQIEPLAAHPWRLMSYGTEGSMQQALPNVMASLIFDAEGRVSGNASCNGFGGTYETAETALSFSPLVRTQMACMDSSVMVQEEAYMQILAQVTRYELLSRRLTLYTDQGELLVFERMSLSDTSWTLQTIRKLGEDAAARGEVSLMVSAEGSVSGSGGCNRYNGTVNMLGLDLTFGPLSSTRMACMDEALSNQEMEFFQALESANRYEIVGDVLYIYFGQDGVLIFQRSITPVQVFRKVASL